jgi:hypothetical protein
MRPLFIGLLSILFLTGCSSSDEAKDANGIWRLSEVNPLKKSGNSFSDLAESSRLVAEGYLLGIFDDGQITEMAGSDRYRAGTWSKGDKKRSIEVSYPGKTKEYFSYTIEKNEQGRELLTMKNELRNLQFSFVRDGAKLPDAKDEPFHPDNNRWRQKAASEEDSAQLRERLLNYIRHVSLILKAADERKQDIVAFGQSQGPIKIYNGGIGIYPFDIVPDSWKNTFYSGDQALTAYRIYQQYLAEGSFQGAATGNWIKDDLAILLSIYSGMKQ